MNIPFTVRDRNGRALDTLMALQEIRVVGPIPAGLKVDSVIVMVSNPYNTDTYRKDMIGKDDNVNGTYTLPGAELVTAKAPVLRDSFTVVCKIPARIQQNVKGAIIRVFASWPVCW